MCDHIARSHSRKAQTFSTTKQHLSNYFSDVQPESVPNVPIDHTSNYTAKTHSRLKPVLGTNEQHMSKTHKCGRRPPGSLLGQYAMKKGAYCPNRGTSGLRHSCSGSSKLPSSGRVNEPSTKTSNAAITQGRLTVLTNMHFFNPTMVSDIPPKPGTFSTSAFFFSTATLVPPPYWVEISPVGVNFFSPPPPPPCL